LRFLALAHIVDEYRFGSDGRWATWIVVVSAGIFLARPTTRWPLVVMLGAKCLHIVWAYPFINNHDLIYIALNTGALIAIWTSWRSSADAWRLSLLRHYFMVGPLGIYGAAAVSKLNAGFFDATLSCAVDLTIKSLRPFGDEAAVAEWLPGWARWLLPPLVAGIELSVPLLLAFRRTRHAGIVVAVAFHLALSVSPTAVGLAFSALLFAALVPFLSDEAADSIVSRWMRQAERRNEIRLRYVSPEGDRWVTAATGGVAGAVGLLAVKGRIFDVDYVWWVVMAPLVTFMGVVLVRAILSEKGSDRVDEPISPNDTTARIGAFSLAIMALVFAVALAAASSPFLGAGTTPAFTMYSNLRTEQMDSNHFVLPRVGPFDIQDDLVIILGAGGGAHLLRTETSGMYLTMHEVRREVASSGGWVDVERLSTGESVRVDMPDGPTFGDRLAFKVIRHRPVFVDGAVCQW
jgi:hypothetical protein